MSSVDSWKVTPSSSSTSDGSRWRSGVVEAHLERLQAPQHGGADPAGGHGSDLHPLDVIGAGHAVGDVPAAVDHPLVGGDVVADQRQDHHHHVLGDADAVAVGDLGDRHPGVHRRLQVDVVGADPGGDRELQVRGLGDPLGGQVRGPERLRDHHVRLRQPLLELGVRAVLVRGDDQGVTLRLEELTQPELPRHAPQQLARGEVDRLRGRGRLAVGVLLDLGDLVARVVRRVPVDRIVVEDTEDRRHRSNLRSVASEPAYPSRERTISRI